MRMVFLVLSRRWYLVGLCLVGLTGEVFAGAIIEGQVKLPPAKPPSSLKPRYQIKSTTTIGLPDSPTAAVYLEGQFPSPSQSATLPEVEIRQEHLQFFPGLLVVRKGTRVRFPNYDDDYHNVLSYSKAKEFDLGRYRKEETPPAILFNQAGVVELNCEIHEHMRGYILVLDTPYFTKTDTAGKYRLENLPAGKYLLKAWVNSKTTWQQPVELKDGARLAVNFPLSPQP